MTVGLLLILIILLVLSYQSLSLVSSYKSISLVSLKSSVSSCRSYRYTSSILYNNNNNKSNDKYTDEEMKLKATPIPTLKGKGYQVILPKNMDLPILSEREAIKILEKEHQIQNEGKTELDILKEQIKKMLDDM